MIADITHGHLLLADWLFLIGGVLAVLAAIVYAPPVVSPRASAWGMTLVALAIGLVAIGFLVL